MKVIESEAIILKNFSLAEADKIVLCLTQKAGLVRLSVRGAKRLSSRFGGTLEPFTIAEIIYSQKEDTELGRLFQAEVLVSHFHLASKLNVLNALSYLSEILTATTPAQEPNEILYRMVRACLFAISAAHEDLDAVRLIVVYFELWLLRLGGVLPDFRWCSKCQSGVRATPVYYLTGETQVVCKECASDNRLENFVTPNLLKALQAALLAPPLKFAQLCQKLEVSQTSLESVTHRLLRKNLEYNPRYWSNDFELEEATVGEIKKVA